MGCASYTKYPTTTEMQRIYKATREITFCLSPDQEIYNVLNGGWMSSPMPLCEKDATVIHSHPWWAESGANSYDLWMFKKYHERYGNTKFGVMKRDWYRVYEVR